MTGQYRYRSKDLFGDYARAAAGALICLAPVVFVGSNGVTVALAAVGLLFVVFGLRTALRHTTQVEVDDQGIAAVGPLPRRIEWKAAIFRDPENGCHAAVGQGGRYVSFL